MRHHQTSALVLAAVICLTCGAPEDSTAPDPTGPGPEGEPTGEPVRGDWLVLWQLSDPESLNPLTSNDRGVSLVLSGHTHAGQITYARLHELTVGRIAGHKYIHGLYGDRKRQGAVYVGAGVGASIMPIRLGDRGRRELTLFELGAKPGSFAEHHTEQPLSR